MPPTPITGDSMGSIEEIPLKRAVGLVLVMDTPKGRGVFATKDIPAKTVVEVSPVLVLDPVENEEHVSKTVLYNYTYNWPISDPKDQATGATAKQRIITTQAVIFGLGSMFNHSTTYQNIGWERDLKNLLVTYTTLRNIRKGEELCISYGVKLTFKDAEGELEQEEEGDLDDWTDVINTGLIDFID